MPVYYPRQGFAKYLGNDKALLDYLEPIKDLKDIKALLQQLLDALPDVVTGGLLTESGELLSTEDGETLLLES